MAKLISVHSATATAWAGITDFVLTVTMDDAGTGEQIEVTFTLGADEPGDMSSQVNAWMAANPDFEVGPYVAPPAVLPDLVPYQFRAILQISGHTDALTAYIAGLPSPQKEVAQAKLDYSLSFQRQNDLVLAAQAALGLTDEQLDALWTQAAAL